MGALRVGRFKTWLTLAALLIAAEIAWGFATPLFSGADEPAQMIKAASVARGEIAVHPAGPGHDPFTVVNVPEAFGQFGYLPLCFAFRPRIPASCEGNLDRFRSISNKSVATKTYVGRYPPLYYLLVGWPTLLMSTPSSLYAMRIISAILNGAMLAVAYLAAGLRLFPLRNSAILRKFTRHKFTTPVRVQVPSTQRNNYLSLGVTIAMTPVVLFNGSIINPNGLEATGAIALWSCLAAMFCNSPGSEQSLLIPLGTVSACITASMRGLSPFWVVVICLIAAIYAGKESISRIFQHRLSKICLATIFAALSLASIWIIWAGSLDLAGYPCGNKCPSLPRAISISAGKTWTDLHQLVNVFGWINLSTNKLTTDTTAPQATYLIWCAVMIGVLLAVAYATLPHRKFSILRNDTSNVFRSSKPSSRTIPIESDTRQRNFQKSRGIALGILVLAVIVMPVILEVSQSRNIGFIWQGRYILPIAVGIPILASGMLRPGHMMVQFVRFCGLILLIGQVIAFYGILHRYSVGANGSWWIFGHVAWSPPLPICLLIALLALSMSSVYWSMLKSIAPTPETISITTSPRPQKID